jgi:hypothetical protein
MVLGVILAWYRFIYRPGGLGLGSDYTNCDEPLGR